MEQAQQEPQQERQAQQQTSQPLRFNSRSNHHETVERIEEVQPKLASDFLYDNLVAMAVVFCLWYLIYLSVLTYEKWLSTQEERSNHDGRS